MTAIALLALSSAVSFAGGGSSLNARQDTDGDGVKDAADLCSGQDDLVDLDGNGVPDCSESIVADWGYFDVIDDAATWDVNASRAFAAGDDANGYSLSGSLNLWEQSTGAYQYHSECFPISAYEDYLLIVEGDASASSSDPNVSTDELDIQVRMFTFGTSDCLAVPYNIRGVTNIAEITTGTGGWEVFGTRYSTGYAENYARVTVYFGASPADQEFYLDNVLIRPLDSATDGDLGDDGVPGTD